MPRVSKENYYLDIAETVIGYFRAVFTLPSASNPMTLRTLGIKNIIIDTSKGIRAKRLNAATSQKRIFDDEAASPAR